MSTINLEQKARETVKKAYTITAEALKETGASGSRLEQLIITLTPKVFEAITDHAQPEKPQAPPITSISTNQPAIPSPPIQMQVFQEFLNRLPAQLRPLFRMKDHTGTEIVITCSEQLIPSDFAAVCHVAEELFGKRVSDGKNSGWYLPLKQPDKKR